MEITQAVGDAEKLRTELLVIGIFADEPLRGAAHAVDHLTNGRLSHIIRRGELGNAPGTTLLVRDLPGAAAVRILLVSLGPVRSFSDEAYRKALEATARALADGAASEAVVTLVENHVPGRSLAWSVQQAGRLLADSNDRTASPALRPSGWDRKARGVRSIMLLIPTTLTSELVGALRRGMAVAEGIALAKDLADLPGEVSATSALAKTARAMGDEFSFDVEDLEWTPVRTIGDEMILTGGRTSEKNAKMIVLQYKGRRAKNRPIVLAGIGTSLNVNGAGSVLGALKVVARLRLPINVVGLIGAESTRRQDVDHSGAVLTGMSAGASDSYDTPFDEGSVLGDLLTYAERFVPASVIGIATLAAGDMAASGGSLYANDNTLAAELLKSGEDTGGRAWQLRLWDDCTARLEGHLASMRDVDAMTAAGLLSSPAKAYSWAFLDVSEGAAHADNRVGCLVALLADFLINRATEAALSMPEARVSRKIHNRGVVL